MKKIRILRQSMLCVLLLLAIGVFQAQATTTIVMQDDFAGTTINTTKWTLTPGPSGTITQDGQLDIQSTGVYNTYATTAQAFARSQSGLPLRIMMDAKWTGHAGDGGFISCFAGATFPGWNGMQLGINLNGGASLYCYEGAGWPPATHNEVPNVLKGDAWTGILFTMGVTSGVKIDYDAKDGNGWQEAVNTTGSGDTSADYTLFLSDYRGSANGSVNFDNVVIEYSDVTPPPAGGPTPTPTETPAATPTATATATATSTSVVPVEMATFELE